jgi:hypothetical protein
MSTPRRVIISWAKNGREEYVKGLPRLIRSALANGHRNNIDCGFLIFSPDFKTADVDGVQIARKYPSCYPCPDHQLIPYGFKPWLFHVARCLGFEQVLWCDSTIVVRKPLDFIWDTAEKEGLFVGENTGCPQNIWTSDDSLDAMGCPRDCAENQIMACAVGIDFRHPKAQTVFANWEQLSQDGITFQGKGKSTRPEFRGHRHDQSAMSWLCIKHQIPRQSYGILGYHENGDCVKFKETCILANTGLYQ